MTIASNLRQHGRRLVVFGAAIGVIGAASTEAADGSGNPFAVKGPTEAPPPPPPSPLDRMVLSGIVTIAGETTVTVVDTTNNKAYVIREDDTVEGLSVADFRSQDGSVVLQSGDQTKRLKLRESKIVTAAVSEPTSPSTQQANGPGGPRPPPQPGAAAGRPASGQIQQISDEEVRNRMERVAEEIRRRRAMRRQMMQQAQSGAQSR